MVEHIFFALAIALGFAAIYFLLADPQGDLAFAAVVLTISAGFLSYRFKLRSRLHDREAASEHNEIATDE